MGRRMETMKKTKEKKKRAMNMITGKRYTKEGVDMSNRPEVQLYFEVLLKMIFFGK